MLDEGGPATAQIWGLELQLGDAVHVASDHVDLIVPCRVLEMFRGNDSRLIDVSGKCLFME